MSLSARPLDLDIEGRNWPFRDHSRLVASGGMDWHVQELGDENAPVALLVHGAGASSHSHRGLMPLLARNHRVIAIDLPGHGFTRGARSADLTLPGMARALSGLLSTLKLNPAIAIGHSAGVAVLLEMALSQSFPPGRIAGLNGALEPIRGNALLSPLAKLLFANPLTSRFVSFQARMVDMAGHLLRATGSRIDDQGRDCYALLLRQPAHVSGALGMMANWHLEPLIARLGEISVPVTLIAAADDPMVPDRVSRQAAQRIPGCGLEILPYGGHLFHEVAPDQVFALIANSPSAQPAKRSVA
ncbi:alpha/beta fold hydrolase BchO [Hoeflea sp.]|uniref:alpha/beta fold hydrolase BchO n=1 Tax=Hoeflea sp. TaxID=1940281 RepID=UPI00374988E6